MRASRSTGLTRWWSNPASCDLTRSSSCPQGVADRGHRVAQFVGQHGQKLILATVGLAQRLLGLPQLRFGACAIFSLLTLGDDDRGGPRQNGG